MLVLLQGLIPKKTDEEEGKKEEEEEELEENDIASSGEGDENVDNNYLKPDNLL